MKRLLLPALALLSFACSSGSSSSSGSTGSSGDDTSSGGSSSGTSSTGGSGATKRPSTNSGGSTTSTSGSATKTEKYSCMINGECFKCATQEQFKTCLGPNNECTPISADYCEHE